MIETRLSNDVINVLRRLSYTEWRTKKEVGEKTHTTLRAMARISLVEQYYTGHHYEYRLTEAGRREVAR